MRLLPKFLLFWFLMLAEPLLGNAFITSTGYYHIKAKTSAGKQTLANFGVYRFAYEADIAQHFAFRPSYSLYTIASSSGLELGYGTDLEFSYLPFTQNSPLSFENNRTSWQSYEVLKPYISLSFHQRQYQSIQSNYAGLGLQIGGYWQLNRSFQIVSYLSSMYLDGPFGSRIQETQVSGGIGMAL